MNLLVSFTDQSPSFTYGVEFGRLLEKIERGDESISNNNFPIRIENVEVIRASCNSYGYIAWFGIESDGWVEFMAFKKKFTDN